MHQISSICAAHLDQSHDFNLRLKAESHRDSHPSHACSFCRNGRLLGVCASVDNCRLFVGGIPKTKKRDEILSEMKKVTEGVVDVIVYPSAADKTKNRGFAFVEYESHRAAAMARRKLLPGQQPRLARRDCSPPACRPQAEGRLAAMPSTLCPSCFLILHLWQVVC